MASREEKEIKSVDVDDQVEYPDKEKDNGQLVLQRLQINYADGTYDFRYAFTWLDGERHITPNRGRALIPRIEMIYNLLAQAQGKGWFKIPYQEFTESIAKNPTGICSKTERN